MQLTFLPKTEIFTNILSKKESVCSIKKIVEAFVCQFLGEWCKREIKTAYIDKKSKNKNVFYKTCNLWWFCMQLETILPQRHTAQKKSCTKHLQYTQVSFRLEYMPEGKFYKIDFFCFSMVLTNKNVEYTHTHSREFSIFCVSLSFFLFFFLFFRIWHQHHYHFYHHHRHSHL